MLDTLKAIIYWADIIVVVYMVGALLYSLIDGLIIGRKSTFTVKESLWLFFYYAAHTARRMYPWTLDNGRGVLRTALMGCYFLALWFIGLEYIACFSVASQAVLLLIYTFLKPPVGLVGEEGIEQINKETEVAIAPRY